MGDEIYPSKKIQIAHLKADEAFIKVFGKYADFVDIFLPKLATKLSKYTRINNHIIKLVDNQQPPYGSIYSLRPIKLKILKIYMKNNLTNRFIKLFKSLVGVFIFFDKKPNESLRLRGDYQSLNNLTIKN